MSVILTRPIDLRQTDSLCGLRKGLCSILYVICVSAPFDCVCVCLWTEESCIDCESSIPSKTGKPTRYLFSCVKLSTVIN